jgi:hypothetical protein
MCLALQDFRFGVKALADAVVAGEIAHAPETFETRKLKP